MEIRFAKTEDIPGILSLLRQVGRVHHEGRPDLFRSDAQKYGPSQVISLLDKPGAPILIAAEGETVLGYCFCQLQTHKKDPVLCDRKELYIDDLCIDESRRGQRIGKALYEAACRYARTAGCQSIILNVWCCNPGAMAFYEAMGMTPRKLTLEQQI